MTYLHSNIFRKIRSTLFFASIIGVFLVIASLLWLNSIGMPESWRRALENKMAQEGYFVRIGHLSYIPWNGIIAQDIHVFTSSERTREVANLKQLILDFDKTKALRGLRQLTKIELSNTDLLITTTDFKGENGILSVNDISGKIRISRGREIEIRRFEGYVAGIKIILNAELLSWHPARNKTASSNKDYSFDQYLNPFVKEISHWQWDQDSPPELQMDVNADVNHWNSLRAQFTFRAKKLSRGNVELRNVSAKAKMQHWLLTMDQFAASDAHGAIHASLNYHLQTQQGHFLASSTIDVLNHARQTNAKLAIPEISLLTPPHIEMNGSFDLNQAQKQMQATGRVSCKTLQFRNHVFDDLAFDFSLQNDDFYLRDINLHHAQGLLNVSIIKKGKTLQARSRGAIPLDVARPFINEKIAPAVENLVATGLSKCHANVDLLAHFQNGFTLESLSVKDVEIIHKKGWLKGRATLNGKDINYQIESNLPPALGKPFFVNQPLEKVLESFTPAGLDETYVLLNGTADLTNIYNWQVEGKAAVKNTAYRGVPVHSAACSMNLSRGLLQFSEIDVNFNYQDYPLRKQFAASTNGIVTADHIHWIQDHGHVKIHKLNGAIYPAPLLRMFAVRLADHIEEYRFHSPPSLRASGIIDVRKAQETKLNIDMQHCDAMTWEFIGQPTLFRNISSQITITDDQVALSPLRCKLFEGDVSGKVTVKTRQENRFAVDAVWDGMKMEEIAKTHQFKEKGYGEITGNIRLTGDKRGTNSLDGEGLCQLIKGELFSVPIFGPLSILVSGMIDDKKIGYERAKDAVAHFSIKKGILETNDFETQTMNLKFTGNGTIDINRKTIDMTMRMNARGIIGLLTFPLSPIIKGLFQFHGTGLLAKPTWNHVLFTSPPEKEKENLFDSSLRKSRIVE